MMECAPCRWLNETRGSRKLVLLVAYLALLLDSMLLTVVVPIIPRFLYEIEHNKGNASVVPTPSSSASNSSFSSIYSLYDNTTIINDHSNHQGIANKTKEAPKNASCNMETSVLQEENVQVGLMFASKAIVQIVVNPIAGIITNRVGFDITMLCGFLILFSSTLLFAFADTYTLMFLARSLQGAGSSLCAISGMGMLANAYPDDYERGKAMGIALGGQALGGLSGPTFGSVMYAFIGKASPFLVLATVALLAGALQLCILRPSKLAPESIPSIPYLTLLSDPYILVAAGAYCIVNMAIGIMEPTLPIWMMETMCPPDWQLGLAFLPTGIMYLLCTNLFGILAHKMGRWLCTLVGLIFFGVSLFCIPLAGNIYSLIGPNSAVGIALAMVDTSIAPIMGQLVDLRHTSVYGGIYAILDMALCLGFVVGPPVAGFIAKVFGFPWLILIAGVMNIVYAPLCLLLRNPPARAEKMAILTQNCPMETKAYMAQSDSPDLPLSDHSSDEELSVPQNRTRRIPR